jgi:hypothetical protein
MHQDRVLGRRHVEPTTSAALATNSGSSLSHQDLRPARSIFWARKTRQTCCSCTSPTRPQSASRSSVRIPLAADDPIPPEYVCRSRRCTSAPNQCRPDLPVPLDWNRPRLRLTVRGIVSTARAIDRVERPSAANKMIRARKTLRCSVVGLAPAPQAPRDPPASTGLPPLWESSQC